MGFFSVRSSGSFIQHSAASCGLCSQDIIKLKSPVAFSPVPSCGFQFFSVPRLEILPLLSPPSSDYTAFLVAPVARMRLKREGERARKGTKYDVHESRKISQKNRHYITDTNLPENLMIHIIKWTLWSLRF